MVKLNFIVNKRLLAAHILQSSGTEGLSGDSTNTVKFQDVAWDLDRNIYEFIWHGLSLTTHIAKGDIAEIGAKAEEFLEDIVQLPEFEILFTEAQDACEEVKNEWESNYDQSSREMESILGFEPDLELDMYITHPTLLSGTNTGNGILWTNRNDWPNYNTVYLWHEALHSLIRDGDLGHAVIELATDNELRVRLNGGTYPPFEGHSQLHGLKTELLPRWQEYLEQEPRNIKRFISSCRKH